MTILRRLNDEVPVNIRDDPLRGLLDLDSSTHDLFSLIIDDLTLDLDLLSPCRQSKGNEGKAEGDKA